MLQLATVQATHVLEVKKYFPTQVVQYEVLSALQPTQPVAHARQVEFLTVGIT